MNVFKISDNKHKITLKLNGKNLILAVKENETVKEYKLTFEELFFKIRFNNFNLSEQLRDKLIEEMYSHYPNSYFKR